MEKRRNDATSGEIANANVTGCGCGSGTNPYDSRNLTRTSFSTLTFVVKFSLRSDQFFQIYEPIRCKMPDLPWLYDSDRRCEQCGRAVKTVYQNAATVGIKETQDSSSMCC